MRCILILRLLLIKVRTIIIVNSRYFFEFYIYRKRNTILRFRDSIIITNIIDRNF